MSSEDKRKHIKSLIDKIPTDKADLFAYAVDWDMVDQVIEISVIDSFITWTRIHSESPIFVHKKSPLFKVE